VTTFDAADHYGPAEVLIGKFLAKGGPELRKRVQVRGAMAANQASFVWACRGLPGAAVLPGAAAHSTARLVACHVQAPAVSHERLLIPRHA